MLGRAGGLLALALLALCLCAPEAGATGWSAPELLSVSAERPEVGIDDAGTITVVWTEASSGEVVGRVRPAGAKGFGPLIHIASGQVRLFVAESGEVLLINTAPGASASTQQWGPDLAHLSSPRPMPGAGSIAMSGSGRAITAWRDGQDGSVRVATREPGEGFGPALTVEGAGPDAPAAESTYPEVAINEQGDALVAWTRKQPLAIEAARRPAGERLGHAVTVAPANRAWTGAPQVAVDGSGEGTVLYDTDQATVYQTDGGGGEFSPPVALGPATNFPPSLITGREGAVAAFFQRVQWVGHDFAYDSFAALKPAGGPFGAARRLGGFTVQPFLSGIDERGNLLVSRMGERGPDGRAPVYTGALSRWDTSIQDEQRMSEGAADGNLAVNGAGTAAMAFNDLGPTTRVLKVVTRTPESQPPAVAARVTRARRGVVSARIRCSETCSASATLVPLLGRHRARAAGRTRHVLIKRRARARVAARLSARDRRRIRKALRRRRVKVELRLRAEDAWGNARVVRRRFDARRLLRQRP